MLKQSKSERNSAANVQLLESTWMLKSPSRRVDGDIEQREVSSSDSSDRKVVEALGGKKANFECTELCDTCNVQDKSSRTRFH